MRSLRLGESELDVLLHVADAKTVTLRQAADHFGQERGWARTTVQKTLERLAEKGLIRKVTSVTGVEFQATLTAEEIKQGIVEQVVQRSLGGSIRPFVAFLGGDAAISHEDLLALKELVDQKLSQEEDSK